MLTQWLMAHSAVHVLDGRFQEAGLACFIGLCCRMLLMKLSHL